LTFRAGPIAPILGSTRRIRPVGVRVTREIHRYRGIDSTIHKVAIMCEVGEVEVGSPTLPFNSWAVAEAVATFLDVPVNDESDAPRLATRIDVPVPIDV